MRMSKVQFQYLGFGSRDLDLSHWLKSSDVINKQSDWLVGMVSSDHERPLAVALELLCILLGMLFIDKV